MNDTAKYLIHADLTAEGVVERSDVVGAIFGQTEGLLGDELDLRELQDASKVGRIDVEVRSEGGQSFGTITIASGLDQVETAILAAALETIDRVGPCRATIEIRDIEDVRSAKRRQVVERAKSLLSDAFADGILTSEELIEEVRESIRVEDVTEYEGYPAGPRVEDSDAIIVVEGRADVLQLLKYGVKNAVAVEGTNVPEAIAELTKHRTVTAFLDGDRGGDLILKELAQVGDVDFVAVAPAGRSVEDLARGEVMKALREKVPYDTVADASTPREAVAATDVPASGVSGSTSDGRSASDGGSTRPAPPVDDESGTESAPEPGTAGDGTEDTEAGVSDLDDGEAMDAPADDATAEAAATPDDESDAAAADEPDEAAGDADPPEPETIRGHVKQVIDGGSGASNL